MDSVVETTDPSSACVHRYLNQERRMNGNEQLERQPVLMGQRLSGSDIGSNGTN
jgi:hypothetical protein